jgi:Flp pilus assembly pilin Flp
MRLRRNERGTTLVEFALISGLLFLLTIGVIDLGLIIIGNTIGGNAARDGTRLGILDYECADSWNGSPVAGHTKGAGGNCTVATKDLASDATVYGQIVTAARKRVSGLVRGTPSFEVRCLDIDNLENGNSADDFKNCTKGVVDIDRDLLQVKITWRHIGLSPFVSNSTHTDIARMVIGGTPDPSSLVTLPTTTSTTSPVTTTTSSSTTTIPVTTTTSSTTTTTTIPCAVGVTITPGTVANNDSPPGNDPATLVSQVNVTVAANGTCGTLTARDENNTPLLGSFPNFNVPANDATYQYKKGPVDVDIISGTTVVGSAKFVVT